MAHTAGVPPMHLIVNPASANRRLARRWPDVHDVLVRAGLSFTFEFTEEPGHAVALARAARRRGVRTVVSVGGDGTLHEVVNGLVDEESLSLPAAQDPLALGVIPFGTGTDFARTAGIPRDVEKAILCLKAGRRRRIDLMHLTYGPPGQTRACYSANVVGLGFDAAVVERVNRSTKAVGGTLPFLSSVLIELARYQNKEISVRFDGQTWRGKTNAVVFCNGRYFGGGMEVGPKARPDDGLIDLILVGDLTRLELLLNLPRIYAGTHLSHPKVHHFQVTQAEMHTEETVFIEAEGELLGQAPAKVRMVPGALWLVA